MKQRTYKEACEFAGCSLSTLKRYECGFCGQLALYQLTRGCGAQFFDCDPQTSKTWPPYKKPAPTCIVDLTEGNCKHIPGK